LRVGGLLRGLNLTEGGHTIEMVYKPASLMLGAGISLVTLLVIGLLWYVRGRRMHENPQ
jgi:uncharacterized membrane protein YfhO